MIGNDVAHNTPSAVQQRCYTCLLYTSFLCAKYALPLLKKSSHGAIVCTGSELGVVGCVESLAYNSSKGGIIQFAKSLALELAPFGIRVNVVCPAGTETPAFVKDMSRSGNYEGEVKRLVASYPLRRLGQPIDIARAVAFLASEEASFILSLIHI